MAAPSFDHERHDVDRLSIDAEVDYDHEHRCAEHEHESQTEETPEPWNAMEGR
jgi:hypothetical protein